jgi:exosortase
MPFEGDWRGACDCFAWRGAMLMLGQFATIYVLVQYAYIITLAGLVLAFTGMRAFRLLAMPLLILVLMIPLPNFLLNNLSTELQLLSSEVGVWIIRLFDISVYLEGNVIDLGGYKLQVADACSGLRYLFPLMTLGFLIAYFYKGSLWKRIVLFLSSIPITLLMNSIRVGTIGVMVEHWGIGMAEGFLHEFQGWAVFMLSAAMLLGETALLNRLGRETGTLRQLFGVEFPAPTPKGATLHQRRVPPSFMAATGVLLIFAFIALVLPRPAEIVPKRVSFAEFPMQMGAWSGHSESMEGVYLDQLQLDDYLLADYTDGNGPAGELVPFVLQLATQGRSRALTARLPAGRRLANARFRSAFAARCRGLWSAAAGQSNAHRIRRPTATRLLLVSTARPGSHQRIRGEVVHFLGRDHSASYGRRHGTFDYSAAAGVQRGCGGPTVDRNCGSSGADVVPLRSRLGPYAVRHALSAGHGRHHGVAARLRARGNTVGHCRQTGASQGAHDAHPSCRRPGHGHWRPGGGAHRRPLGLQ